MAVTAPAVVDLTLQRGDSDDITVTVTDDVSPTPNAIDLSVAVDGTPARPAIIRFAVKKDPSKDTNAKAAVLKLSYDASEIEILPQAVPATKGQCVVKLDKPDTSDNKAGDYSWDIEVTRQDVIRTSTGIVALVASSQAVVGTGTQFNKAKIGDVLHITSGPNAGRASLITAVTSATALTTERVWSDADATASFEIRRGKSKTAAYGKFTLAQDVVL